MNRSRLAFVFILLALSSCGALVKIGLIMSDRRFISTVDGLSIKSILNYREDSKSTPSNTGLSRSYDQLSLVAININDKIAEVKV
jgi:hypothetical protein